MVYLSFNACVRYFFYQTSWQQILAVLEALSMHTNHLRLNTYKIMILISVKFFHVFVISFYY